MKKFWIISAILIVIAGVIFTLSLTRYIGIEKQNAATVDETEPTKAEVKETTIKTETKDFPAEFNDNGMFSANYESAYKKMSDMTNEELVGQLILGTCKNDDNAASDISKYHLSGYYINSEGFADKSESDIKSMVNSYRQTGNGFMVAVDEEGGQHTALTDHGTAYTQYNFSSIRDLYAMGSLASVETTENDKCTVLKDAGVTLNLGPDVDISTEGSAVMFDRSLGEDSTVTGQYAQYAVKAFQEKGVSACLKHFPGYGNLMDNTSLIEDTRSKEEIMSNDILPFKSGIASNAHFVMVGNMLVRSIDDSNIASLSPEVNKILRNELGYTGMIITENLDTLDYSQYSSNHTPCVQAILAGCDMVFVDDYESAFNSLLQAVNDGVITKEMIQKTVMRILAYKQFAGLL